ncbi:MAG TPA: CD225/dispanin family protein [Pyrinomonadaceae bacterium]|nr:CD225/dispanin family protein [Pyrinomonadaceae bacterium]
MSQEWTPPPPAGTTTNVPNYLVPAIISAVCCFPLGIISIIFAAQVNGKVAAGDIAGALNASKMAKIFSYVFIGLALLGWGGYIIIWVVIGGAAFLGNM